MLTFISGWKSPDRDQALINNRNPSRRAVYFLDDTRTFLDLIPDAPLVDLYRNGRMDFKIGDEHDTLVRLNYDTEQDMIVNAVAHTLISGEDAQIIVTFDAVDKLYRLFPALRASDAVLAANERLDAPAGDRVLFTRGGSFRWKDHVLEARTSLLASTEVLDAGIVPDEDL